MSGINKDLIFKKGIWIKEQQGRLTLGSLDDKDQTVTVIPDQLCQTILEFENDIIHALYGDDKVEFNPEVVDIKRLLQNIEAEYKNNNLRISLSKNENAVFKGDYDKIFSLIDSLITKSLSHDKDDESLIIYINASILDDHLCIIYRDSQSKWQPLELKSEIQQIKIELNGEINLKTTGKHKSYLDIMIPSEIP